MNTTKTYETVEAAVLAKFTMPNGELYKVVRTKTGKYSLRLR